jgi:hypothetical protein
VRVSKSHGRKCAAFKQATIHTIGGTKRLTCFAKDGVKAKNSKENIKIACNHFEKVYNRKLPLILR